jgi:hypothetical protein
MNDQPPQGSSNGEEARVLDLALRLLAQEDPVSRTVEKPGILVGRLPEEAPVDIPILDGFVVVGSLVRSDPEPYGDATIEVVLDTRMSAGQAREAYRERMVAAGWSEPEHPGLRGGGFDFVPVGTTTLFCRSEQGPALFFSAHEGTRNDPETPTDIRLRLITGSRHSPCAPERNEPDFDRIIPLLTPPSGSYQFPGGGGGGIDSAYSDATLETDLDPAAVGTHYAAQLEEAGWSRLDEGQGGPQAWSIWSFTDEDRQPWEGVFTALRTPQTPSRYFLQVYVGRTSER